MRARQNLTSAKNSNPGIDEYIAGFPKNIRKILEEIRVCIKTEAPGVEETISYGMPAFRLHNTGLVYFSAWKKHIGLYPISSAMEDQITELSGYYTSGKGTVRFPLDKPIPLALIKKIVKCRMVETAKSAEKRSNTKKASIRN